MNILFCYSTEINPQNGGVERVTDILAREMYRRGHNIFFLHNYFLNPTLSSFYPDYDYIVRAKKFPYEKYNDPRNIEWYHNFLKKNQIDIVINQNGQFADSYLFCDTGGICKTISVAHMSPDLNLKVLFGELKQLRLDQGKMSQIKRILRCMLYPKIYRQKLISLRNYYNWLSTHTDCITLLSERFYPALKKYFSESIKLHSIPNPLTYPIVKCNDKENIILWVGRMDYQKRPDLMLKIWRKLAPKNWKLIMIGGGKLLDKTIKDAKSLKNIELKGYCDPLPYYKKAKILCMTSGHEGFGMVLTEAMSQGCVPIAFNSYEAIEDILKSDIQLVKPFDVVEYVSKLNVLIKDPKILDLLKLKGYHEIEKFRSETIVEEWEKLIKEVVK